MMTPARIVVGVPCQDQCQSFFAHDLAVMMAATMGSLVGKGKPIEWLRVLFEGGTLIAPQRYNIVKAALHVDATHILWLDSDMRFPADTLQRLLGRERDIVGANYSQRRPPCGPTAFNFVAATPESIGIPELVYTYPDSTGCEKVQAMGLGVALTRTEVFRQIPEPWFALQWGHDANGEWSYNGEDTNLWEWARKAGYDIWLDHDLSQQIVHLGQFEYQMAHALHMRDAMADSRFVVPREPSKPKLVS